MDDASTTRIASGSLARRELVDVSGVPEPWATAAERAGIRQTIRGIAEVAGLSHATVSRLIREGRTSPETVVAVAKALRVEESEVYRWAGVELSELGPWSPPMEAHLMTPRMRAAVTELILAAVEHQRATNAQQEPTTGSEGRRGEVTDLHARRSRRAPSQGLLDEAARPNQHGRGRAIDAEFERLGEESQDEGGS